MSVTARAYARAITKATLLFAGLQFSATVLADPAIVSVDGGIGTGNVVVIEGSGFTAKTNPRPLFWWTADGGDSPSSLGRKSSWDGGFDGDDERQQVLVSPGSQWSYRFDHGAKGAAALGRVDFDSARAYVWRKKYDGFDITTDWAIRTRFATGAGTLSIGQVVTGQTSGASGVVQRVGSNEIFYEKSGGTINRPKDVGRVDFAYGELMTTPTWSGTNAEGSQQYPTGTFRTFNWKTIRFWTSDTKSSNNNVHANAQGVESPLMRIHHEYTTTTRYYRDNNMKQEPRRWNNEQVVYESSDIGVENGRWWFAINNRFVYLDLAITRDAEAPLPYGAIYQSQVSNGAQPGSWVYYDSLYVDDSWHRVLASSAPRWEDARDVEVQIPISWSDGRIEIVARLGSLDSAHSVYLYVVDSENRVNKEGFRVTLGQRPAPPDPLVVD